MRNAKKHWGKKLCSVSQEDDSPSTPCSHWSQTHSLPITLRTFIFPLLVNKHWITHITGPSHQTRQLLLTKIIIESLSVRDSRHLNIWELPLIITEIYLSFWEGCTQVLKITSQYHMQIHMLSECLWFKTLPFIEEKHLAIFRGRVNENVKKKSLDKDLKCSKSSRPHVPYGLDFELIARCCSKHQIYYFNVKFNFTFCLASLHSYQLSFFSQFT